MKDKSLIEPEFDHMPTYFGVDDLPPEAKQAVNRFIADAAVRQNKPANVDDAELYRECYLITIIALQNIITDCKDLDAVSIAENAISDANCVMLGRA